MAAEVKLDVIIEALEMAADSISSYLDVETGEVHSITEEEFDLAEDPQRHPSRICQTGSARRLDSRGASRSRRASDTWLYLASSRSTSGPSWTASP
jgi:hypothetical protein